MASVNAASFRFSKFGDDQKDLTLQGDAKSSANRNLQLTKLDGNGNAVSNSVGRVLYSAPLYLRDVVSFETNFTFSISSGTTAPSFGLAFFIASYDSQMPPNSGGENLGLFPADQVVAVEFLTFPSKVIGINVNDVLPKATASWEWRNDKTVTAHISYNSASKTLSVSAFYPGTQAVTLSYDIDLYTVLPDWVRVGFSASTGQQTQANTIHSWSFSLNNNIG